MGRSNKFLFCREEQYFRQKPVKLERLVEIAKVQSTESSNKIEGIVTTSTRIKQLCEDKTTPRNRDEKEIMGYRDVLNTIHESHDYIPIRPSYILQLHRDLLQYAEKFLYRSGYEVGKYISIESKIEKTKSVYYDVLEQTSQQWHEAQNDPTPFIKYLLGIILSCYRDFEKRVDMMGKKSTAYDVVRKAVSDTLGKFTKKEILERCPSLKSSSVENALKRLYEEGYIERYGSGRNTFYAKSPEADPLSPKLD